MKGRQGCRELEDKGGLVLLSCLESFYYGGRQGWELEDKGGLVSLSYLESFYYGKTFFSNLLWFLFSLGCA